MAAETLHRFIVDPSAAGERLDRYLAKRCPELSRSQVKLLIENGEAWVGRHSAKAARLLKAGEEVGLRIPPPQALEAVAEDLPLQIVYQDRDLLVLDKSAEMVVHLGAGVQQGTLVNALLHHCSDLSGIGGKERPGIVHRLDKGTSGLLVVAKNDAAHRHLSAQFKDRQVEKTYYAFVWGRPKKASGKIELALGRSQRNRKKIATRGAKLRPAVTNYRVMESWGPVSLLELKPETGRTHQLRVHLSEIGHPIVGDPLYGSGRAKAAPVEWRQALAAIKFQLLHAGKLSFHHPRSGKALSFEAPLREEMGSFRRLIERAKP
ncbi:MAG TPA: RluA family pseudouridine synthase [bacterium]|nr:RluA family pseudouridine synthase [bacterium]